MHFERRTDRNQWVIYALLLTAFVFSAGTAYAERLSIASDSVNIRSGPGTKYPMLWQVEQFTPIEVINRQGEWIYFKDFEGTKGWIHKSLVTNAKSVVTIKDLCNVRSGPGAEKDILFKAERGVPFKVLEKKGHWLRIQHVDGDKGWIMDSLVW